MNSSQLTSQSPKHLSVIAKMPACADVDHGPNFLPFFLFLTSAPDLEFLVRQWHDPRWVFMVLMYLNQPSPLHEPHLPRLLKRRLVFYAFCLLSRKVSRWHSAILAAVTFSDDVSHVPRQSKFFLMAFARTGPTIEPYHSTRFLGWNTCCSMIFLAYAFLVDLCSWTCYSSLSVGPSTHREASSIVIRFQMFDCRLFPHYSSDATPKKSNRELSCVHTDSNEHSKHACIADHPCIWKNFLSCFDSAFKGRCVAVSTVYRLAQ